METKVLTPEVEKIYDLNTIPPGIYAVPGFGIVNLCTISKEQADRLVAFGFPFLTPKPVVQAPAKKAAIVKDDTAAADPGDVTDAVPTPQ